MSKTTDRLKQVATELEDIVANFEENQKPTPEWTVDGWNTLIENIHHDGLNLWMFTNQDDPTTVLHELYIAYKDLNEHIGTLNQRIDAMQAIQHLDRAVPPPPQFIRQNVNWDEIRQEVNTVGEWPALGAFEPVIRDGNVT